MHRIHCSPDAEQADRRKARYYRSLEGSHRTYFSFIIIILIDFLSFSPFFPNARFLSYSISNPPKTFQSSSPFILRVSQDVKLRNGRSSVCCDNFDFADSWCCT